MLLSNLIKALSDETKEFDPDRTQNIHVKVIDANGDEWDIAHLDHNLYIDCLVIRVE